MYPHRIRLRGPWQCEPIGELPARRVTMPCNWAEAGLADFRGAARFVRKFGYPGRIDEDEHVWLTCAGCTGLREMHLNGTPVAHFASEITSLLTTRNQLEVLIAGDTDTAGLWGEVALEIRKSAWLSDLRLQRNGPGLLLTGGVMGVAPQPLEVYTIVDGQHVDYRTIQPSLDGQSFHIELSSSLAQTVRVELIHISAIWYIVEMSIRDWLSD